MSSSVKRFCSEIIIINKEVIGVRERKWYIHNIVIPQGVLRIGSKALSYCINATSIQLPDTLTHVYDSAFEGCKMITFLTLPDTLTHVGTYVFRQCVSLSSIRLPHTFGEVVYMIVRYR